MPRDYVNLKKSHFHLCNIKMLSTHISHYQTHYYRPREKPKTFQPTSQTASPRSAVATDINLRKKTLWDGKQNETNKPPVFKLMAGAWFEQRNFAEYWERWKLQPYGKKVACLWVLFYFNMSAPSVSLSRRVWYVPHCSTDIVSRQVNDAREERLPFEIIFNAIVS